MDKINKGTKNCGYAAEEAGQIRAYVPELEPGSEEITITKLVNGRLAAGGCLRPGSRESVAYRLAEIMVSAKNLYTEVLPGFIEGAETGGEEAEEYASESERVFDDLAGVRMAFIHMRDLIADFEDAFMDAIDDMHSDDNEDEDGETFAPENFFED
ncbi:hypothetical protein IJT93_05900 [bacterium]|nr:hypothetical protein [bacterium]